MMTTKRKAKMPTRKADPAEHGTYYRGLELDARTLDKENRTVRATLSTDRKIDRFFGFEQLDHSSKAVDLNRASRGLPLLFAHDQTQPIGRAQNLSLSGTDITADLRFGNSMRAEEIWQDVVEGVLADVSIGYRVSTWEEMPEGRIARKWELLEASVVAVPADAGAAIHRSEETIMPEHGTETIDHSAGIVDAFRAFPQHAELMFKCLDDKMTVEQSRAALLARLGERVEPVQGSQDPVTAGEDKADKFNRALEEALAVKFDARPRPELARMNDENTELARELITEHDEARKNRGANPLVGMSLLEMAREHAVIVHGICYRLATRKRRKPGNSGARREILTISRRLIVRLCLPSVTSMMLPGIKNTNTAAFQIGRKPSR
jgi:HK97 family phage prohead protease